MDALRTLTSALGHYDPDASDNSLAASYRKAVRLTGQIASLVATWGRMQQGGGPIAPDPAMGHAANFLYMLTGQRPSAMHDQDDGRGADAACRPRAERVHLRGARGGGHAHRRPLGHRRRHRHAEGAAARRRQRRGDEDADRHRPGRAGRAHRRLREGEVRAEGEDQRLRPPCLQDRGSAGHAPAPDVEGARPAGGQHALVRHERAHRGAW